MAPSALAFPPGIGPQLGHKPCGAIGPKTLRILESGLKPPALAENEATILQELLAAQGSAVDIGGYFDPDPARVQAAMRPSETLNRIIESA